MKILYINTMEVVEHIRNNIENILHIEFNKQTQKDMLLNSTTSVDKRLSHMNVIMRSENGIMCYSLDNAYTVGDTVFIYHYYSSKPPLWFNDMLTLIEDIIQMSIAEFTHDKFQYIDYDKIIQIYQLNPRTASGRGYNISITPAITAAFFANPPNLTKKQLKKLKTNTVNGFNWKQESWKSKK